MKILHAADLHLDTPFQGQEDAHYLRQKLLTIPQQLADLCQREQCHLVLLAGDLFDGPWTPESLDALRHCLEEMAVPVFIAPGNHDFCSPTAPYHTELWPGNVHIFTQPQIQAVHLPQLDTVIYGAGYDATDCPALLEDFRAQGDARYHIGLLHGDPTQKHSPYCPVTADQIAESNLDYLALGHIHKWGTFRSGQTLCAWPGCPMGRGFDETGDRGALVVTLSAIADARFVPLSGPRFHDLTIPCGTDPVAALNRSLPPLGSDDYYRISLTGEAEQINLPLLRQQFTRFPHLQLKDRTQPLLDVWGRADSDSLEGVYFGLLKEALNTAGAEDRETLELAARISRQLLEGREVSLP